jgi:hypothetical protein
MWRIFLFFAGVMLVARPSWAQGNPLGGEFRVNTFTTGSQGRAEVASDPSGNFVVVWPSQNQDGSVGGVFGQRYASSGAPLGSEFRVNSYTTDAQSYPSVAVSSGSFVVVWRSYGQDGSLDGGFGQRYASSGAPLGPEFRINTFTTSYQFGQSVAADAAGNFVVVWISDLQDGSNYGIFGQRYASAGAPLGPEFRVNTFTPSFQLFPSVAADPSGNFVVVWQSDGQEPAFSFSVFGQRYASSGAPLGPEFRVNTYTTGDQVGQFVASDSAGNFVVVWTDNTQDGSGFGTFGQRYASSGIPLGPEFRVNTYTPGDQIAQAVASDSSGNFVVVWTDASLDGSLSGVFAQRYASSGGPLGPEFRVNTYTSGVQGGSAVAADGAGNFVVVWTGDFQDGSSLGVFGQRYAQIVPVELMHFDIE